MDSFTDCFAAKWPIPLFLKYIKCFLNVYKKKKKDLNI